MTKLARFVPLCVVLSACGVDNAATHADSKTNSMSAVLVEGAQSDIDDEELAATVLSAKTDEQAVDRFLDPSSKYIWATGNPASGPSSRCVNTLVKMTQDARALRATAEWDDLKQSASVAQLSGEAATTRKSCNPRRFVAACTQSLKQLGQSVKVVATSQEMRAVRATQEFKIVLSDVQTFIIQGCLRLHAE